jgi:hypothetical protein
MTQIADQLTVEAGLTVSGGANISGGGIIHGSTSTLVMPVSAVSSAAVGYVLAVPAGASITNMQFQTLAVFTGATVSGALGSATSDATYVAATTIKQGNIFQLTPLTGLAVTTALGNVTSGGLVFTLEQGTPTAVGSGNLLVTYVVP